MSKKMTKILIIYSTTDGQTFLICEKIKSILQKKNQVELVSINDIYGKNISNFDSVIIGASIRYGKHSSKVIDFVKKNKTVLSYKKTSFFTVNVVARKHEKNTPETNPYMLKFLKKTNWEPNNKAVFAGKIDYPKYGFIDKQIIRFIMILTNGPTDTSKSYEFTDWSKVDQFAREISE
tara:strand:- start:21702 stop:22235 length:534 start_codon:yes stop_codon:yes gene_type:complete